MSEVQIAIIDQEDTQITLAVPGVQGPVGNAIPVGGTTNQVLFKSSATNYDATWGNVTSAMITDLAIVNADVNASAGIVDTKLATIATAGKVSNSATTAASANTASAIVARDASGNFTAGTITATLTGNASTVTTNANLTGHVTSVGNAAVLGSFTSAQLATALTDETGTGSSVFATSPTLVTPALGTPSSGTLTNCTFPTLNQNTTGNAATVTTNANLTGDVTSVGNATSIAAGVIVDADINASAAIVDTKLATIATAGKVSNSATTAASANTASAIVARDASGNFTAGTITAALTGAASSNVLKAGDTMTGVLAVTAGTAALPAITPSGDPNTGIYSPGADQLAVATNGTERLRLSSTGALGVGGANFGTTGQALISNGSSAVPTWQDLDTAVFGWDHDNDTYGLYLPGTSISTGSLSGTINIDVQSRIRRCVINDSGVVEYYLDADASTNKSADWLRIVETESLATAYTGAPAAEATNSLLRVGVPAWAAGTFTRGQRVTNGGYLWECVAASSTATPAAGAIASVLDGTNGQVVVEIPAFSVRYGFINGVHTREVRLGCNDGLIAQGFRPHPAFIKTDGTYKSAFYWGAYQAYSDGTNLASVSGQTNTRSLTRATFRTRAALRGTGWHVQSYLELAAIQTLLVTEYRDYNSQKVLGNGSIEGATFGVSTGLSNSRGNRSGNVYTGGGSSSDFMSYRGIENLYGRAWTWADGINVYERVVYLTNNQSVFADNTSVGYSFYAQVPSGSSSYQKELFPLADVFLPSVVTGASSTTYLADGFWTDSGWRVAFVGGSSDDGSLDGAFGLALYVDSGDASGGIGARSAYAAN